MKYTRHGMACCGKIYSTRSAADMLCRATMKAWHGRSEAILRSWVMKIVVGTSLHDSVDDRLWRRLASHINGDIHSYHGGIRHGDKIKRVTV